MSNDIQIIRQLEKKLGVKLKKTEGESRSRAIGYKTDTEQNVTALYLNGMELTEFPFIITEFENLTALCLRNNSLMSLPSEISQLNKLTVLDLSINELSTLPSEIVLLQNLNTLFLAVNKLNIYIPELFELRNLRVLSWRYNQLRELPHEIGKLRNLIDLDLWGNELRLLPDEIFELTNLQSLQIGGNKLQELSKEICQLKDLTELIIHDNEINLLPQEITRLKNLSRFVIGSKTLTSLPQEIFELEQLTDLAVVRCFQLNNLPPQFSQLKQLTRLGIRDSKLEILPQEIAQLENLRTLDLSGNQLEILPQEIGRLKKLKVLRLHGNHLTTLPREIGELKSLKELDLKYNNLTRLPTTLTQICELETLELKENPLKLPPPEIASQGVEAVFEYLDQISSEAKARIVNEAKLIIVGQGDVGKTCLSKRLIYDKFIHDKTTEGINIVEWEIIGPQKTPERIKLNVWDFGGQEIYHATHQFFLTKRSVYLLVWNARKSQDYEHIYYWLHTIEAFGGDSPIILVMSKCNERDDDLNMKDLREKFPQIVGFCKVDSQNGTGINLLKDIIYQAAWNLSHMQTVWIQKWFQVRECLAKDRRNWIEYEEYKRICQANEVPERQADILAEYLHNLGVIIHFRDRLELKNLIILKPEWATSAVYKVLDAQSVRDRQGILLHSELDKIWSVHLYPLNIYPKLLELMKKFELSYELPDRESHLIAELLPKTEPDFEWDNKENLRFYYRYDFLPAGVITRFIVLIHQDLEMGSDNKHLCWRGGATLQREGTRALVKVKPMERLIEIRISGKEKRELLAIIRHQFDHINSSIKKIIVSQEIPCNCSRDCGHIFNYNDLINGEQKGKKEITCPKSFEQVSLSRLLNGYEKREDRIKDKSNQNIQIHIRESDVSISEFQKEVKEMSNISMQLGDGTTVHGDFVVANKIKDSFNKADTSNVQDEFKDLLKNFAKAVGQMTEQLPKEQAQQVANDLQSFTNEMTSEKPRRKWWELSLDGIKEAAKNVGEIGKPVLELATRIAAILSELPAN